MVELVSLSLCKWGNWGESHTHIIHSQWIIKVPALGEKFQSLYFHNLPPTKTINLFSLLPHRWYCRLFRVPWTARTSNQSILKEIIPEYSLEGLILKLKLQYFGHLIWRTDSFEKTLMLGKIAGRKRREQQRMRWLDGVTNSIDMSLGVGDGQGGLECCSPWGHKDLDTTEWLNSTELNLTDTLRPVYTLYFQTIFQSEMSGHKKDIEIYRPTHL